MDSQDQGNMFYTNLLQGDSNIGNSFLGESQHAPISIEDSQPQVEMVRAKKPQRGGNFSIEEDICLVSSWINVSQDPVQGTDQKYQAFWARIHAYFHERKEFLSTRSSTSLMNRWSTIQQLTNKFCGYLTQIENMNQSGTTEHDNIAKAKAMYHKIHDVSFPFEHCWNLLKDQPKWMRHAPKEKPKRRSFMATSSNLTPESPSIAIGDDALDDNNGYFERPIGRKAEKAKRKKIERTSEDAVVFMKKKTEILEETRVQGQEFIHLEREKLRLDQLDKEHRRIIDEEKLNMERKKFQLQQQDRDDRILEREEDREERILEREEKIMLIDTSGMSLVQQKYWNQRQLEISQKR